MIEPIHIINLGAGVQSSTMALMAAHGEITPMPKCAIFADTQDEPKSVYKWLDWLEKQLPFQVHRVTRGKLSDALTTLITKVDGSGQWVFSGIPTFNLNPDGTDGHVQRQCTSQYKISVIQKELRRIVGASAMRAWRAKHYSALKSIREHERTMKKAGVSVRGRAEEWEECWDDALVQSWIGISLDEVSRMKSNNLTWQVKRYPLIDLRMRRHDCLLWMIRHGYPKPPRSACVYCPYHTNAEWRRLRDEEPEAFAEAVRVDHLYRKMKIQSSVASAKSRGVPYLHASRVPLDRVDFSTDIDRGQQELEGFGNECEGMCGV